MNFYFEKEQMINWLGICLANFNETIQNILRLHPISQFFKKRILSTYKKRIYLSDTPKKNLNLFLDIKSTFYFNCIQNLKSKLIRTSSKLIIDQKTQEAEAYLLNQNKLKKPRCPSDYQATRICLNPNCEAFFQGNKKIKPNEQNEVGFVKDNTNPFICSNHQCRTCFYSNDIQSVHNKTQTKRLGAHSKCFIGEYDSLLACLQKKKNNCEPSKQSINKMFESFIGYLLELRQKYIIELEYYGLSQNQRKFFLSFKNGQFDHVTSQLGFSIVRQLNHQMTDNILSTKQKLENYWLKQQNIIKKSFEQMENFIFKEKNNLGNIVITESKIMISDKQKEDLIKMLQDQQEKSVNQLSLLYRASQNDFDTHTFHQNCDLIQHTVVVIQTEYGKKIGGYTPLVWDGSASDQHSKDSSGKSFIFSLTNNHKFTLLKSYEQKAIYQHSKHGPIFGGGYDIFIYNQGNIIDCYANIGSSYFHPEYQRDQNSLIKFSGATEEKYFNVKEWQVFQVKWN